MKSISPSNCEPICIVCGSDENYSQPLAVAIYSTLNHLSAGQKVDLTIIDGGLTPRSRARLERVVQSVRPGTSLDFVTPSPEKWSHLAGHRHISAAAYLRLFIPTLLPPQTRQSLYLDCDILVQGDIAPLWKAGTGGCAVAAIRDFAIASITHPWSHVPEWQQLGIDPLAPTFNTGILLLDLDYWRENGVTEHIVDYAVRHAGKLDNCDQDAINAILASSWKCLDETWNVQYSLLYLQELPVPDQTTADFYTMLGRNRPQLLREAKIFHFTDRLKPWQHWCRHPATLQWAKALLQSNWFSPLEALRWALPWLVKFSLSRLKLKLGLTKAREKTGVHNAPFVVQPDKNP